LSIRIWVAGSFSLKTEKPPVGRPRPSGKPAPKTHPDRSGALHVELFSVGRDLLRGRFADDNGHFLAGYLSERGCLVHRITVVDDHEPAIVGALREALGRSPNLIFLSGGSGVASDDLTLQAVAAALERPLTESPQVRSMVEAAYSRLYKARMADTAAMTETREKLCRIPVGGEPVPNRIGIVPGSIHRLAGGTVVICLPGTPEEMEAVLVEAMPLLKEFAPQARHARREIEAPTADESALRPLLDQLSEEFPYLWISSRPVPLRKRGSKVFVTLEAIGSTEEDAAAAIEGAVKRMLAIAGGG